MSVTATLTLLLLSALPSLARASVPDDCDDFFAVPFESRLIKTRDDGTRIFEVDGPDGRKLYFKENFASSEGERAIFDDLKMTALAAEFARKLGLEKYIPDAKWRDSMTLIVNGESISTRPGVLQEGVSDLVTPIDEFQTRYRNRPDRPLNARNLQRVLNTGDWPRLYADWKIFWSIFHQVDLNIANLAKKGDHLSLFDLGDLMNLPATRRQMGIRTTLDEVNFNMPNRSWDRVEHRADFRLADPEFKNLAKTIAEMPDDELAFVLGKHLDESFDPPRGSVRKHVTAMKLEAKRIVKLFNRGPFDY